MKDKNLPPDNDSSSLEELTAKANKIIELLENEKNLSESIEHYQKLLKLNNIIEKRFQQSLKFISEETKKKLIEISKKR